MDWYNFFHDVDFPRHPVIIGGPGVEVKIDGFAKESTTEADGRRDTECLGEIERASGKTFLVEAPQRNVATLIPIIQQYIR